MKTITDDNYFDHDADMGVIGRGPTLEDAFCNAAEAMFALMATDLSSVKNQKTVRIEFQESDVELAFVTWLNFLLAKAREENAVFSHFQITRQNDMWHGIASGEVWHDRMEHGIEVKGATLTMLSVKQKNNLWEATCVVDL